MDHAMRSPSESEDRGRKSTSVVSLEDPDERMAVEALSGLGNAGMSYTSKGTPSRIILTRTEYNRPAPSSQSSRYAALNPSSPQQQHSASQGQEPLLRLLVEAHPWVGGTINGSLSAYTTTKNYSPRFVQYGANLIERNIGSPMANTVSSVGKKTGVEGGIRKYLDSRRPGDIESAQSGGHPNNKRKATQSEGETDSENAFDASSPMQEDVESLPAYRSSKPPSYREEASPSARERHQLRTMAARNRSWGTQIMISTSGLGVACSESSRKSLTYCVGLLTTATEHIETAMKALKLVLEDLEQTQEARQQDRLRHAKEVEAGVIPASQAEKDDAARRLADRIQQLCDDIWNTLKTVVNSVSTYAGGALPENARLLVKGQLLSIPQRWRAASQTAAEQDQAQAGESDASARENGAPEMQARKAAHRMIAFAEEGLDMMAQVNGVVQVTLQSAETWLQNLGRGNCPEHADRDPDAMDVDSPSARAN